MNTFLRWFAVVVLGYLYLAAALLLLPLCFRVGFIYGAFPALLVLVLSQAALIALLAVSVTKLEAHIKEMDGKK